MQDQTVHIERRGLLLVLSSPSGAGKTSLARGLLESDEDINMSVSVTTRPVRPGETDGVDYFFADIPKFEAMRNAGDLLEWAPVFGNYYGTPRKPIEAALSSGKDVLFDIDWQGTQQLAERMPSDLVRVFILPPSAAALEHRLKTRAQDSDEVVAKRMAAAASEISHWAEYDYIIVNADLAESLTRLRGILAAERLRRERMTGLSSFVRDLQSKL